LRSSPIITTKNTPNSTLQMPAKPPSATISSNRIENPTSNGPGLM
jgi:hypothetical protein